MVSVCVTGLEEGKDMEKNKELSERARALRKSMTKEEQKLWKLYLCRCQPRFHRQYVIGNYIADFYCHKAKLVVELDGSQHYTPEEKQYDEKRTKYLQSQGLQVIRFSNLDDLQRFHSACAEIDRTIKENMEAEQV